MRSDEFKNKNYGTKADKLILQCTFCDLGMEAVLADTLRNNTRSQRALERQDSGKNIGMMHLYITDVSELLGMAKSKIGLSDNLIITHIYFERNKIFILLRSLRIWVYFIQKD